MQTTKTEPQPNHPFPSADLDLVLGRKFGTVILLHGTHGSGKTLAAEVFANCVQKPLLSIGYGEMGDSTKEAETALAKNLYLAQT